MYIRVITFLQTCIPVSSSILTKKKEENSSGMAKLWLASRMRLLECQCGSWNFIAAHFVFTLLYPKIYCFKMDKANTNNKSLLNKDKKRIIDDEKRIFYGDWKKNLHLLKKKINQ